MTSDSMTFRNGALFDGERLHFDQVMTFRNGVLAALAAEETAQIEGQVIDLNGDILCPGFVDLQVNGGGGAMFNDDPSVDSIRQIAEAHRRLGVASLLPTLITDTPEKTEAAVAAAIEAVRAGVPGVAGLHLEGPHLSVARKGAHDGALIRPMEDADLTMLIAAAEQLPCLKVTLAPESVSLQQVQALSDAGILVSLGHSNADFETCRRYAAAGARCVTHLFNAMSQLGSREPGLVGAALATRGLSAGLIADGIHVHPEVIRSAWAAKKAPGQIFLVSDAMAVAGTDQAAFELEGRLITRTDGRLTLEDGTLAGADLDLTTAIRILVTHADVPLKEALASATTYPASLIGQPVAQPLRAESMIRISSDLGSCSWICSQG
ncbi:N-acetylglucosamine-6-phosphate deacetylase [Ruegeria arenilitoris]|uniref:N-acetylglucosamine-6-phosphate deacetylase n=1 Tax=Ruegeria arenilitoris TaxID=1173585 RepID=UPI00147D51D0|nr:N-acetylglucosamine-6-phosphate deacetylase [Ruegeria arenilitoris]